MHLDRHASTGNKNIKIQFPLQKCAHQLCWWSRRKSTTSRYMRIWGRQLKSRGHNVHILTHKRSMVEMQFFEIRGIQSVFFDLPVVLWCPTSCGKIMRDCEPHSWMPNYGPSKKSEVYPPPLPTHIQATSSQERVHTISDGGFPNPWSQTGDTTSFSNKIANIPGLTIASGST